jgi:hypothetical protein
MKGEFCLRMGILLCTAVAAGAGIESLRVQETRPAVFDYQFASIVSRAGAQPVLAFNQRDGKSFFLKVGDPLGEYRIVSFDPRSRKVFNPSLNARLEEDCSVATLKKLDGSRVVLERGRWLPQPGLSAVVVHLETDATWTLQAGDALRLDDEAGITVADIRSNAVFLSTAGTRYAVPVITEDERQSLLLVRKELRRQREQQRQQALLDEKEAAERRAAAEAEKKEGAIAREKARREAQAEAAASRPKQSVSVTDYYLPIQSRSYPVLRVLPDGRVEIHTIVLPPYLDREYDRYPFVREYDRYPFAW